MREAVSDSAIVLGKRLLLNFFYSRLRPPSHSHLPAHLRPRRPTPVRALDARHYDTFSLASHLLVISIYIFVPILFSVVEFPLGR